MSCIPSLKLGFLPQKKLPKIGRFFYSFASEVFFILKIRKKNFGGVAQFVSDPVKDGGRALPCHIEN